MNESLLQPSLAVGRHEPLYSTRATFLISFFGGPFATLFIMGMNSRLRGRLEQDAPLYVVAALVTIGGLWALVEPSLGGSLLTRARDIRTAVRFMGFLLWGALYLRHRALYRAAELEGDFRSPWVAGIGCVVVAAAIQVGIIVGFRALIVTP